MSDTYPAPYSNNDGSRGTGNYGDMSVAESGPRPEPVLDAQKLTQLVLALLGALSALFAAFGFHFEVERWDDVVGTIVGLGVLAAGVILPRVRAKKARALVTPLSSPRSAAGVPLTEVRPTPPTTRGTIVSD